MTDFKAKMHQIRFRLGLRPRPRWGSLERFPRPPAGFGGPLRGRGRCWAGVEEEKGEGKGREGEVEGREKGGPKLLLNQGPSEPCYATDYKGSSLSVWRQYRNTQASYMPLTNWALIPTSSVYCLCFDENCNKTNNHLKGKLLFLRRVVCRRWISEWLTRISSPIWGAGQPIIWTQSVTDRPTSLPWSCWRT